MVKQFADGITDTKVSMWILLGGNVLNIIGNYILIYGKLGLPEMGLSGAGISTLTSRILMVIAFVTLFFMTDRYKEFKEGFKRGRINKEEFTHLNKLGWPIAGQMGMETASFSLSAIMIGWLGRRFPHYTGNVTYDRYPYIFIKGAHRRLVYRQ